jgi:hypothetical protein
MKNTVGELLNAPWLKIERAKHHIHDLNREMDAFLAERPYALVYRDDPDTRHRLVCIKTNKAIPEEFSLMLGDAIHNTRSALDLLIFGMVGDKAPPDARVQFPFCKRKETLDATLKNTHVQLAGKKVIDAIKALKPYPGGNELLSGLNALDIADKHKLILPVGRFGDLTPEMLNQMGHTRIRFQGPTPTTTVYRFAEPVSGSYHQVTSFPFEYLDPAIVSAVGKDVVETEAKVQPTFEICFPKGELFANTPIIIQLHVIVAHVIEVLELLSDRYVN